MFKSMIFMTSETIFTNENFQATPQVTYDHPWWDRALKRGFDIFASFLGLILLAPFFGLIVVLIKIDSPGPGFYRGRRMGRGGREFDILKFRTMYDRPESFQGSKITARGDNRVTPIGRWLRNSKINELPQLWNVLVGEMSLVGPRPEDVDIARTWPAEVFHEVLSVRPGLTSPASVLYRNEEAILQSGPLMDTYFKSILPSKLRLDQLYIRHRSFLLDLDVLLWTALVIFIAADTMNWPEERLFLGPLSRIMRRYVSWFTVDLIVSLLSMGLVGVFWRSQQVLNVGWPNAILLAWGFALIFSISGAILGANRISWSGANAADALDLVLPTTVATLVSAMMNSAWTDVPIFPPSMVLAAAALSAAGFVVVRYRMRLLSGLSYRLGVARQSTRLTQERALIIGGGETGQFAAWMMQNNRHSGLFHVVGYVDDDLYKQNTRIRGVNVLGRRVDIPTLVAKHDVGVILFAIHNIGPEDRQHLLKICAATTAQVVEMPNVLDELRVAAANQNGRRNGTNGNGHKNGNGAPIGVDSSHERLKSWLNELDSLAQAGDMNAVQARLKEMHSAVSSENNVTDLGQTKIS
jgi:lipopolysaccharide/colanic/teichoic acid biosynthesis glycosyltransferase